MVISKTPLRLSFVGGGTDLPSFFREEEGAVLTTALNKYVYVAINDRFDQTYRLSYNRTEICSKLEDIEHPILRVVLKKYLQNELQSGRTQGLEVVSIADIPAGTGLGSSSTFTVGVLNALGARLNRPWTQEQLAAEAARIEIEELGEPIGHQDQYIAAFGGLQFIRFLPSGEILVEPVAVASSLLREIEHCVLFFYTGITRSASKVLTEQNQNVPYRREGLRELKRLAYRLRDHIVNGGSTEGAGDLLHQSWSIKKTMASGVSTSQIDEWYERAMRAGAWGGKILGAGGGGFLMLLCHPEKQAAVKAELSELRPLAVKFERSGSTIVFSSDRD